MLASAQGGQGLTVKRLEKQLLRAEAGAGEAPRRRPSTPASPSRRPASTTLAIDELHDYKNLRTRSNIRDAAIDGSNRATRPAPEDRVPARAATAHRVITGATATPIANSVTEAHVMQRYLRPDLLAEAGVLDFDAWAATFGQTVTEIEMAPSGGGNYRLQTRFARFQNVPEMLRMWHVFADVKTAEDLKLPTPAAVAAARRPAPARDRHHRGVAGDRRATSPTSASAPSASAPSASRPRRTTCSRSAPTAARPRWTCAWSTGSRRRRRASSTSPPRRIAGDLARAPRPTSTATPSAASRRRARARCRSSSATSARPARRGTPTTSCATSSPRAACPRERVRFIHEARNDAEKGRLFAAARAGQVAVLIGSTEKMGVGINVQARAIALHHIDCPWRPGRHRAARRPRSCARATRTPRSATTATSSRAASTPTAGRPSSARPRFIAQIMRGRLDVREIDDIGDSALSFAEVKALASGDPLILEKAAADAERTRLERLQRAHQRNQHALARTIAGAEGPLRPRRPRARRDRGRDRGHASTPAATRSR